MSPLAIESSCFLVLDLDDTLYREYDYQTSGLRAVGAACEKLFDLNAASLLLQWRDTGEPDPFGRLCEELGLPESGKESLVWIYRNHFPDIELDREVRETLASLERSQLGLAILTDGRSVTQRMKLKALGLDHFPVYISEDYGETKPGTKRFEIIERLYGADSYCYIGDNPRKDFLAPKALGWKTIGVVGDERNIHSQVVDSLTEEHLPDIWIDSFSQLKQSASFVG